MTELGQVANAAVWISLTIGCYILALKLFARANYHVLLHPIIVTALMVLGLIGVSGQAIRPVVDNIELLHWLLGPTTVALAIPIYRQGQLVKQLGLRLLVPIVLGGALAPLTAWGILLSFDSSLAMQLTILTKSITTPLAMDTASIIGGIPSVAAIIVIITGIVGVLGCQLVYRLCAVQDDAVKGLVLGIFAHGIGTAKAIQISERAGAFASLALGINGIITALILSIILGNY